MSAYRILILASMIAFAIGAFVPVLVVGGSPRALNWISLGLALATAAWFANTPG